MVPAHLADVPALFLMGVWVTVWFVFVFFGRRTERRLPLHQQLVWYSSALFISITIFYWIAFSGIGSLAGYIGQNNPLNEFLSNDAVRFVGTFASILGAACMMLSRWHLRDLTLAEVLLAKCESNTSAGLYHYFRHPMYLGLFLILIGSLILYPNLLALFFLAPAWFFVEKKKEIEESNRLV